MKMKIHVVCTGENDDGTYCSYEGGNYAMSFDGTGDYIAIQNANYMNDFHGTLAFMVYLTDVDKNDSNFSFLPKTHLNNMPSNFKESRYNDNSFNSKSVEWYGKAGDAMMFDTNIIHRLRRSPKGRVRDSLTLYYTPGQFLKKIKIDSKFINNDKSLEIFNAPFWGKRV